VDGKTKRDDEWGTPELTQKFLRHTPGQVPGSFKEFLQSYLDDITPVSYKYRNTAPRNPPETEK
jgi:hypothetical protein